MTAVHTHRLVAKPSSYAYCWAYESSPTTQVAGHSGSRTIGWAPGDRYVGKEFWLLASFRPNAGRTPGRILNFHNHPERGGWLDSQTGGGVSAIAFDWFGDQVHDGGGQGLVFWNQAQGQRQGNYGKARTTVASIAEMDACIKDGTWMDLTINIGIDDTNGFVKIWKNGADTPVVNLHGQRTSWEHLGQTGFAVWSGLYNSSGGPEHSFDWTPLRIGRTLAEALADVNVKSDVAFESSGYTHTVLTSRTTEQFRLPPSLAGGGTPPPPPPPPPPVVTNAQLRDEALAHLKATTVSYPAWQKKVDEGKYPDVSKTEWWLAQDALGKIK